MPTNVTGDERQMGLRRAGHSPARPRRTPRQRVLATVGLVLVVAGASTLVWVGWQLWGTNWVSHRKQEEAVAALRTQWDSGRDVAKVGEVTVTSVVRIPRFGEDYLVPMVEGTSDAALATGFGHFTESAAPGDQGNFALAAHRITHGEPLRDMPSLQPGDKVVIETRTHVFTYVLDTGGDDLVVPFTDSWVLDRQPVNPHGGVQPIQDPGARLITLTTCSELFHTDNRMIAFGHLESREPRP
jgi:sortase A